MAYSELAIVGDIGATNMRLGVARIDSTTGRAELLSKPEERPTPLDPDHFFHSMARGVMALIEEYPEISDGAIGFPGPVVDGNNGRMVGPITNIASLKRPFDLSERLADVDSTLGDIRMISLNDAEAATYAAPFVPGVSNPDNQRPLLYITHSTGIGGETIQNHKISSRLTGQLAEYGHVPILQPDGTYRTLEKSISGPNMERLYGNGLSIFELGTTEGEEIDKIWEKVGRDFAHGLGMMLPIVGPSDVVIGGGISRDHHRYDVALRTELEKILAIMPPGMLETPTISYVPKHEVSTFGLVGARYAIEQYRRAE
jgi:predicted NBD/HSP70 family sugar kinase